MNHVYEVKAHHPEHGYVIARVEADNEREALALAKSEVFVRKMTAREVHDVTTKGLAINWKDERNNPEQGAAE